MLEAIRVDAFCSARNKYSEFRSLSPNLNENLSLMDSRIKGRFKEHIFRLGAYCKLPCFIEILGGNYTFEDSKSIYFSSGTKSQGGSDCTLLFEDSVVLISCKSRETTGGLDSYDHTKLVAVYHEKYSSLKPIYGFQGSHFTGKLENAIHFDDTFIESCWNELYDFVESYDFDFDKIQEHTNGRIVLKYKQHQIEAINKAKEVFEYSRDCLFFHSPRTGKTLTALGTAKSLNCKKILWLTPMPSINYQVTDTVAEFDKFKKWTYFDFNDSYSTALLKDANVVVCSFQRLDDTDKYSELFDINWDIVVIDEVHTHSETSSNQEIIDSLKTNKMLWLSATPFKNIMLGRFDKTNTHQFTNIELYELQKTNKDYAKYPKITHLLYNADAVKKMVKEASVFYEKKEWFTFNKLFEIVNGEFVYKNQVKEFIEAFFINTCSRIGIRSLDIFQKTRNILLFVPSINAQEKIVPLMREIFEVHKMSNIYSVDYTNSKINNGKTMKNWIKTNTRTSKQINIVLAVDQLSCGVTLPTCDMVVLWNDSVSESEYIQRSERCKNPKDDVENVYVIDFNPHRCLQSHGTLIETISNKEIDVNIVSKYLDHMNFLVYGDSDKFKLIDPEIFVKHYEAYNYPLRQFSRLKYNMNFSDEGNKILSVMSGYNNKATKTIIVLDEDLGIEGGIKNKEVISSNSTKTKKEDNENKKKIDHYVKSLQFINLLTGFKHKTPEEMFNYLNELNLAHISILSYNETMRNQLLIQACDEICRTIFKDGATTQDNFLRMNVLFKELFPTPESYNDYINAVNSFKKAFLNNPAETIKLILESDVFIKEYGEVFTPEFLIKDMLSKLPKSVWRNPNLKWLDNSCGSGNFLIYVKNKLMVSLADVIPDKNEREKHILENMLYGVELQAKNLYITLYRLDKEDKYKTNFAQSNALEFDYWNEQFDIIIGNPPYQENNGNKGTGHTLWDKFVTLAVGKLLKQNGYLVYVHPSVWRQPKHTMLDVIKSKQLIYLEIHDSSDGQKVFRASTRYDWYVLKNCPCTESTKIKGQDGVVVTENLNNWDFIPNAMFKEIKSILAKDNEQKVDILHSFSAYESRKKWVSKVKVDDFVHPLIYSTQKDDIPVFYWSSKNDKGHYGVPKVILSNGAGVIVDETGEYGLTEWARGIVETPDNLPLLKAYLDSPKFENLRSAIQIDSTRFNIKIACKFKKDFWK
jgi:hypothetical protein